MQTTQNKVLVAIVDNDEPIRRAMARLLSSLGFETESFASGREFIDKIGRTASFRPGCVIVDMDMPGGLSGLDVVKYLEAFGPAIPAIIVTASSDPDRIRHEARNHGAVAVLRKPIASIGLLRHALDSALK